VLRVVLDGNLGGRADAELVGHVLEQLSAALVYAEVGRAGAAVIDVHAGLVQKLSGTKGSTRKSSAGRGGRIHCRGHIGDGSGESGGADTGKRLEKPDSVGDGGVEGAIHAVGKSRHVGQVDNNTRIRLLGDANVNDAIDRNVRHEDRDRHGCINWRGGAVRGRNDVSGRRVRRQEGARVDTGSGGGTGTSNAIDGRAVIYKHVGGLGLPLEPLVVQRARSHEERHLMHSTLAERNLVGGSVRLHRELGARVALWDWVAAVVVRTAGEVSRMHARKGGG